MEEIKWTEEDVIRVANEALNKIMPGVETTGNTQNSRMAMAINQAFQKVKGKVQV